MPTFHALLIGADGYFPNRMSNDGSYRALGGCVHDVARIAATLAARVPGAPAPVTLIAAAGPDGRPIGDPARWPTAANLRRELAAVAERAQPGDQVYIHYSGHGGRVITAWRDLKGGDGVDEALVPIDIGVPDDAGAPPYTRPERYVRDVELALYLDRLAAKVDARGRRVTVTLVFDSCHSGGTTRGISDQAIRAASGGRAGAGDPHGTLDRRALPADHPYRGEQAAAMAAAFTRLRGSTTRAAAPARTSWLPPASGYVLLAGCRDVEAALECAIDGRPRCGVLTDALLEALDALGTDQSWKTVYDRVLARVQRLYASQTPQLLGDIDRHVLGVDLMPIAHTLTVTDVAVEARTVTINGGLALTVTAGTELAIYHPGTTDFSLATHRVAIAKVTEARALDACAVLSEGDPRAIAVGAPAVIRALALRRKVQLHARLDLPPALRAAQDPALAAVAAAIQTQGLGFLELSAPGETPHYQVALTPEGCFELCDPRGVAFAYLEPVIRIDARGAAGQVVAQLRRLGRYHTVLEMCEPESELRSQLHVELLRAPAGWTDRQPVAATGGTPLVRDGDAYLVAHDTWLWLRLRNAVPSRPVHIALLDLTRKWEIEMIIPDPDELRGKRYETIADVPRTFALRMYTPIAEAIDVLKLFLTTGEVDFPALATTGPHGVKRSDGPSNALGRLIEAIDATRPLTREAMPARSTSSPWTVQELRMRTVRGAGL